MEKLSELFKKQIELETLAFDEAAEYYLAHRKDASAKLPAGFKLTSEIFQQFCDGLRAYKEELRGKPGLAKSVLGDIPAKDIAFLTLNGVVQGLIHDDAQIPIQKLAASIGADLYDHTEYLRFVQHCKDNGLKTHKWIQENTKDLPVWMRKEKIRQASAKEGCVLAELRARELKNLSEEELSNRAEFKIGEKALDILMESVKHADIEKLWYALVEGTFVSYKKCTTKAKAMDILPTLVEFRTESKALCTRYKEFKTEALILDGIMISLNAAWFTFGGGTSKGGNNCLYLKPTTKTEEWLNNIHELSAIARPKYLPCVIPPKAWDSLIGGGYYLQKGKSRLKLFRSRNLNHFKENASNDLSTIFSTINTLQETKWEINKEVLKIIEKSSLLPSGDVEIPPPIDKSVGEEAYKDNLRLRREAFEKRTSQKSQALAAKSIVKIAKRMAEYNAIYFPHTLDYRGRVYPVPSYLNPQGHDIAKGLLQFVNGLPLGENGEFWLAVHGANCWKNGVEKYPLEDRFKWVKDATSEIINSAASPLEHTWWTQAKKKWNFLAFCFEWAEYKRKGKEEFKSHLSIDMDGTCNGLQHLCAIVNDEKGGALVGLRPQERPSDVYSIVAAVVSEKVHKDAEAGNPMAQLWMGKVDRDIVKRPVMTQGYGVTKSGMKRQIAKNLSKREGAEWEDLKKAGFKAFEYMEECIHAAISKEMPGVFEVKNRLRGIAELFTKKNLPIRWKTPAGINVLQENFKQHKVTVKGFYGITKIRTNPVRVTMNEDTPYLDKDEQMNGIAPNIIHSLDGAHLMLTVNACRDAGITDFHAIHDSYGVHACHVDTLHRITREQFVKIYGGDVIEDLWKQFEEQLGEPVPEIPLKGTLDIREVLSSKYFWA